jgi:hypothetical protein
MKKIKILITVSIALFISAVSAQEEAYVSVNSLGFEVSSLEGLKTINWDDMLTVFEENSAQDSIEVSVRVKDLKLENKYNGVINDMSVSVTGVSENKSEIIEELAQRTDKMVKILERMTK